jgi:hypothetical protein
MIDAELHARYAAADFVKVATTCDRSPPKCDDPVAYERLLLESHNASVQTRHADDEAVIEHKRHDAHFDADRRALALVGEVAAALSTEPKCRSYPSAFSEVTYTICAR